MSLDPTNGNGQVNGTSSPAAAQPVQQPQQPVGASSAQQNAAAQQAATRSTYLRDELRRAGMDLTDEADDAALAPLIAQDLAHRQQLFDEANRIHQENLQYRREMDEYLKSKAEFEEFRKSRQAPQQPAAESPAKPKRERLPKWDEEWEQHAQFDPATQQWRPKSQWSNPVAVEQANRYHRAKQKEFDRFVEDPVNYWKEAGGEDELAKLRKEIADQIKAEQQALKQEWQGSFSNVRTNDYVQQYMQENADLLFQPAANGQRQLTWYGQVFNDAVSAMQGAGVTDKLKLVEYADAEIRRAAATYQQLVNHFKSQGATQGQAENAAAATVADANASQQPAGPQQTVAPQATAAERRRERQDTFVNRIHKHMPPPGSRDGSVALAADTGRPQNAGLSFRQMAEQQAAALGVNLK